MISPLSITISIWASSHSSMPCAAGLGRFHGVQPTRVEPQHRNCPTCRASRAQCSLTSQTRNALSKSRLHAIVIATSVLRPVAAGAFSVPAQCSIASQARLPVGRCILPIRICRAARRHKHGKLCRLTRRLKPVLACLRWTCSHQHPAYSSASTLSSVLPPFAFSHLCLPSIFCSPFRATARLLSVAARLSPRAVPRLLSLDSLSDRER